MTPAPADPRVARVVEFFERLSPGDVARLHEVYAANARFRDPFNDVRGIDAIARIFDAMFERLEDCRFVILEAVADERGALLTWDFTFRIRRWRPSVTRRIHGATHLRFDADGRIDLHRDYWDAAGELYEQLPLVGPVLRRLRRWLA
jgi:steroid delta-isomerase